jgi:nucleoside-diphosphate-sugar epimerase
MRQYRGIPLFGNGDNLMEVLDIRDAARLLLNYVLKNEESGIFNLLSSGAITQREFAETLSLLSGFPVKDYRQIFPGGLEKEAVEAFTSNISLATKYPGLKAGFQYTDLKESLKRIFTE